MEMLEVRLIGKFEIKYDGKPVAISSRAAQSLFAYLILNAGTPFRREKLAGMFWPDATETKARASLRQELWRIRKVLSSRSKFDYLSADDINVSFNSSAEYWLDVITLTRVSEHASVGELMNALSVFQAELLPGFYEDWVILEREHLQAIYEQKMARLLELLESEKRWPDILEWAERWLSLGNGPEAVYRVLMVAYAALGDHAKVASTYERCLQALRGLDLEPSEQTRALAFKRTSKLNVPIPLTSFIGRETELGEIADLLSKYRLVTLTGSGGVGKTRLSIQVVAEVLGTFPDGVWFLDLAPLTDPALVPTTLANLLGLRDSGHTKLSITELLINYLSSRTALIIFDNCEHLIGSSAELVNLLLISCENLSILATSREALRVSGEIPYRVPSLEIPKLDIEPAINALANIESVRLFTERAARASLGFAIDSQNALVIARICQRLDGIPLAIELAAARANMLTVEQILKRLDDRFNLLTGGLRTAQPRHQTLRAMIEWSYELLSEPERLLFRRLAVFKGGCTLEAAEEVCRGTSIESGDVLNLLSQLVNKSLVVVEAFGSETRYRMLETIRQYARDKLLESNEMEQVRRRHLAYFLQLVEQAEVGLTGTGRKAWLERLELEHDNLRAALAWSLERDSSGLETGLRLAGALFEFWYRRGYHHEGREWLERLLAQISLTNASITKQTRAKALYALGFLLWSLADYQQVQVHAEASLTLYQELGDERGIALALNLLGVTARAQRDYPRAIPLLEQSLAISGQLGDKQAVCYRLYDLALVWWRHGEYKQAEHLLEESLALGREVGDTMRMAETKTGLAVVARAQGKYHKADVLDQESLMVFQELGDKYWTAATIQDLGELSWRQGDYAQAKERLEASLELLRETGAQREVAGSLSVLGNVALSQGDVQGARSRFEQMETITEALGDKLYKSRARQNLANVAFAEGNYATAQALCEESLGRFREINSKEDVAGSLLALGNLERVHGNLDAALGFYRQSLKIRYELRNPHDIAAVLERMAALATGERQGARAARLFAAAAQMREQVGAPLEPIAHADYERDLATIKAELSDEEVAEEWALGRALTMEQAIEFALENDDV
jgi:predicted ATPase/DNA-binding SARP family transcriptional activator